MTQMTREEYQNRVLGCFVGKNIGGTLGMPMEWERSKNDVTYYTHDITGDPLPNDDLDIQILWLLALEEQGLHIDSKILGQYFNEYMIFTHAEYGVAKTNLRAGLQPPVTGTFHNKFKDSCGSYIRSDIWACLFPGNPEKAAEYAALQTSATGAAKRGYVDQIIEAADTRKYVIGAFEMLFTKREIGRAHV
mgnify:CR=1 FL=1